MNEKTVTELTTTESLRHDRRDVLKRVADEVVGRAGPAFGHVEVSVADSTRPGCQRYLATIRVVERVTHSGVAAAREEFVHHANQLAREAKMAQAFLDYYRAATRADEEDT